MNSFLMFGIFIYALVSKKGKVNREKPLKMI